MGNQISSTASKVGHVLLALIIAATISGVWSLAQHNRSYGEEVTNKTLVNADFNYLQKNYRFWDIIEEATNDNFKCIFQIETGKWFAYKLDSSGQQTDELVSGTLDDYDPSGFGWSSKVKAEQYWPEGCIELMHDVDGSTYPESCLKEPYEVVYQDIATVPGETYEWSFMLAGYSVDRNSCQFVVGAPGSERAQAGTVLKQNACNGGSIYSEFTLFTSGLSHAENDNAKNFVTFGGTYTVPEGQTVTRIYTRVSTVSFDSNHWPIGNYVKGITFAPEKPWIEVSASEGGTISNAGKKLRFEYGDETIFTITPDEGYELADLLLDGASVLQDVSGNNTEGATITYTAKNLETWATLQAVFDEKTEQDDDSGVGDPGEDPGNNEGETGGDNNGDNNNDENNSGGTENGSGENSGVNNDTNTGDNDEDNNAGNNGDINNGNVSDKGDDNTGNLDYELSTGDNEQSGTKDPSSDNPGYDLGEGTGPDSNNDEPNGSLSGDINGDDVLNTDDNEPSNDTLNVSLLDDDKPNTTNYGSGSMAKAGDGFVDALLNAGPEAMAFGSLFASALYLLIIYLRKRLSATSC